MIQKINLPKGQESEAKDALQAVLDQLDSEGRPGATGDLRLDEASGAVVVEPLVRRFADQINRLVAATESQEDRTCAPEFVNLFGDTIDDVFGEDRSDSSPWRKLQNFRLKLKEELGELQVKPLIERFRQMDFAKVVDFLERNPQHFGAEVQKYILPWSPKFFIANGFPGGKIEFYTMILNNDALARRLSSDSHHRMMVEYDDNLTRLLIEKCGHQFNKDMQRDMLASIKDNEPDIASATQVGSLHHLFLERVGSENLSSQSVDTLRKRGFKILRVDCREGSTQVR